MNSAFGTAITPASASLAIAVLVGAGVRVAILLHQRKAVWPARQR